MKSVLTSLAYTDVLEKDVLILTTNQWFDDTILGETSLTNFYFPSINYGNLKEYKKKFFSFYEYKPNEITILSYDSVGLIYYLWKKNIMIKSSKDFNIKNDIKGKIGSFKISGNKIIQKLDMYSVSNNAFVKGSF